MYKQYWKRVFDFTVALLGILLLLFPIGVIAVSIWITSGSPIIFSQDRVGKDGKLFRVKKFRTMKVRSEVDSSITVAGDRRITPIGQYLRKWKLDELPQLWNVLVGEMSLVGPRPDVPNYADKLQGDERQILQLRPGITGPATLAYRDEEEILTKVSDPVKYNDEVIYPDKVKINLEYIKECSFRKDLYYIAKTVMDF